MDYLYYICSTNNIQTFRIMERKVVKSFRLPEYLVDRLAKVAKEKHRSVNNLVEVLLFDAVFHEPNEETLAAMREAESGKGCTPVDSSSFEAFLKSMDE